MAAPEPGAEGKRVGTWWRLADGTYMRSWLPPLSAEDKKHHAFYITMKVNESLQSLCSYQYQTTLSKTLLEDHSLFHKLFMPLVHRTKPKSLVGHLKP